MAGSTPPASAGTSPNWATIEVDYRAGVKSLRAMAEEHGITHGAINKRAKRDGWTRDLTAKIQARADELVSRAAVSTEVSTAKAVTEQVVVEVNASLQAQTKLLQRGDAGKLRRLCEQLEAELFAAGSDAEALRAAVATLAEAADQPPEVELEPQPHGGALKRSHAAEEARALAVAEIGKLTSVHGRLLSARRLGDLLEQLHRMECRVLGIKDNGLSADPLSELLTELGKRRTSLPIVEDA